MSLFFFLLASSFLFVLTVARYALELTTKHLLNNQIKTVQNLMTDLGYFDNLYFSFNIQIRVQKKLLGIMRFSESLKIEILRPLFWY